MATLAGNTIASTYPLLLKIDSSGIDGTLRAVEDGDGTDSALSIATDSVLVKGDGVKLYFYDADGGEHISADASGNLTIGAGVDLNLTATTDINIPVNVGLRFGDGGENIETDNTNLTITSGGGILLSATANVGIGVSDPDSSLEINSPDNVTATALKVLALDDGGYTGTVMEVYGTRGPTADYNIAKFGTNAGTAKIVFDGEGKVGIGTTSPTSGCKLHIKDSDAQIKIEGTGGTNSGFIDFDGTNLQFSTNRDQKSGTFSNASKSNATIALAGPDGGSDIKFYTASANNTTGTLRMNILSAGDVTVSTGNLVIPTAGKGISFTGGHDPDTAGSATGNVLDDYEEGTWTITANNSVTLHAGTDLGAYTRIGRVVHCQSQFQVNSDNSTAVLSVNLPFTTASTFGEGANNAAGSLRMYDGAVPSGVLWTIVYPETGNTILNFSGTKAGSAAAPILATADAYYMFSITYMVAT